MALTHMASSLIDIFMCSCKPNKKLVTIWFNKSKCVCVYIYI